MEFSFTGRYEKIPEHMKKSLSDWVLYAQRPGSFLWAVITNDLRAAVRTADDENLRLLPTYVAWFYWEAPSGASGDPERATTWKGLAPRREGSLDENERTV